MTRTVHTRRVGLGEGLRRVCTSTARLEPAHSTMLDRKLLAVATAVTACAVPVKLATSLYRFRLACSLARSLALSSGASSYLRKGGVRVRVMVRAKAKSYG